MDWNKSFSSTPDIYVVGSSTKGGYINRLRSFGLFDEFDDEGKRLDMTVRLAYTENGWFRRCIDILASSLASMPWEIMQGENVVWDYETEAPGELAWLDVWDMMYRYSAAVTLEGQAASLMETDGRRITNLLWWNPTKFKAEKTPQGITRFERTVNSRITYVDAENVLYAFAPDVYVELGRGSSDGGAARIAAQILHDLDTFTSDQLRSGLVKKTVFVSSGQRAPNEDEKNRVRNFLKRWIMGAKGTRPEILNGIEPKEIGSDLSDLSDNAITEKQREAISTSLGIPHSLVMSNAANYATARADQVGFTTGRLMPLGRQILAPINRQFFSRYGLKMVLRPDKMEVMQQHELEKAQAVKELVGVPVWTIDEGRDWLGFDPATPDQKEEMMRAAAPRALTFSEPTNTRSKDLGRWRKCVESKGRDYDFTPDTLTSMEANVIRERLAAKMDLDRVFDPPFVGF